MRLIRRSSIAFIGVLAFTTVPLAAQTSHDSHDVGVVVFPNSGSAAAQAPFLRGIALLHNFVYGDAIRAFQEAERADPHFALPYWFEALAWSPILWNVDDAPHARPVLARLGATPAERLATAGTSRERAFGAAIEAFYADADLTTRMHGFADSLNALAARDSTDLEALAFAALANLMYVAQPRVAPADRAAGVRNAIALASLVARKSPRHPGAPHYLIHVADADNAYALQALNPAFDYAGIAPAAEHAQHMPSHIFLKLGMWQDQVAANERAWHASTGEMTRLHRVPTQLDYHDFVWLQYGYLQQGRYHLARALADSARHMIAAYDSGTTFTVDSHYAPAMLDFAYASETGQWNDGPTGAIATTPIGGAAVRERERRQLAATNWEIVATALMRGDTSVIARANTYPDTILQGAELQALVAERRGDRERALATWQRAASLDTSAVIGPPRFLVAREQLAALLLAMHRPADAAAEYERSLTSSPGRATGLLGLARARAAAGDTAGAAMAYRRLLANWSHADADLPALAEVRRGAARATVSRVTTTNAPITKQPVWFKNGSLMLEGYLFKPEGPGPFPALIWNHGSEETPGRFAQFDSVGAIFTRHGYAVLAPARRGHDESDGEYIGLSRGHERMARGTAAGDALTTKLLATEQLSDQLAGLSFLRSMPFVDTSKVVVAGCSFGGIQTLMAAEGNRGLKAAVAISPAAQNWDHNAPLRARLIEGVSRIHIPVLIIQPPKDASLGPIHDLGAEFIRLHKDYRGTIYPTTIPTALQGHCFGAARGMHVWENEAVAFLDSALSKPRRK